MGLHFFYEYCLRKCTLKKLHALYIFGDQHKIAGRSTQVVKTKKTRSAVVISFQVVSRRDGGSKARLALAGWLRLAGGSWLHKVVSLSAQIHFSCKKY